VNGTGSEEFNLCAALLDEPCLRGRDSAPAIREPTREWCYAELFHYATKTASALYSLGIRRGDRVALLLDDSCEFAAAFLGIIRIGAVAVPLSVLDREQDYKRLLLASEAVLAIVQSDFAGVIEALRPEAPTLRHLVVMGGEPEPGQLSFAELIAAAPSGSEPADTRREDPAFLLFTSGSRGNPKGVCHRHATPIESFAAYGMGVLGLEESDRFFVVSKKSTAAGLGAGLCFPLAAGACTFMLPDRPRPRTVFEAMTTFSPTVFFGVPSFFSQLLHDLPQLGEEAVRRAFSKVRLAVSTSEPLPPRLWHRVHEALSLQLLDGWGSTETFQAVLSNRPGAMRPGSSGHVVLGYEARVVDEDGRVLDPSEIGELEVRGPTVVTDYEGTSSESGMRKFRDGWLRTGDLFFCDADGYFWYSGRSDGRIRVGPELVAPAEVEHALLAHPAVWECAVVGAEDEDGLLKPLAYVVPNVGHTPSPQLARDIMHFVKDQIAPVKYPRWVEFVDELPKDATGRVLRHKLRPRPRTR